MFIPLHQDSWSVNVNGQCDIWCFHSVEGSGRGLLDCNTV